MRRTDRLFEIILLVRDGRLHVEARAVGGRTIDAFEVKLPAGEALARITTRNPARAQRIGQLR